MVDIIRSGFGEDPAGITNSKVVTTVVDLILLAIHEGTLIPGQHINDGRIALQFGVSRTPVREAIQRLRELGIIEASRSRFTRIANVSPQQTAQAYLVWQALYAVLIDEVVEHASSEMLTAMTGDRERFLAAVETLNAQGLAMANLDFFGRLTRESHNPALQRAINSVVHVVRLGSLHLPDFIDLAAVSEAHSLLLEAVRRHDLAAGRAAMVVLRRIEIPLEAVRTP